VSAACILHVQVEVALSRLKDAELDHDDHLVCLEALARLAWSDDSVRQVRHCRSNGNSLQHLATRGL
jgi:hypothetical protein